MEDDKDMFELMTKMYAEMQSGFKNINSEIRALKSGQEELKASQEELKASHEELKNEVRKTNAVIENDIKPKIEALFDGYKQHGEQLNRIEKEVSKHEEIILRRVK